MITLSSDVVLSLDAKRRENEMMNNHAKVKESIENNNSKLAI